MSTTSQFPPRVRFNWGFHDAQHDMSEGRTPRDVIHHFDKPYAAGYMSGIVEYRETGVRNASSGAAWAIYQGHLAHARTLVTLIRIADPLNSRRI